jgi:ATP adenylyltransferase
MNSPGREALWTPWRMRYVGGDTRELGCVFCNRLRGHDDVRSLILYRSAHAFVIMNLYPYNTGHVMVVPQTHVADLDVLDQKTLVDMATLLPRTIRALRHALTCDGFNIGVNLGADAGAGVAEHLHQHVVPRWQGDANFMPILAGTMVLPELIPATYAKVRAEMARELDGASVFDVVVVSDHEQGTVWLNNGTISTIDPDEETSVWRSALTHIASKGAEIIGWSGSPSHDYRIRPGLIVRTQSPPAGDTWQPVPLDRPHSGLDSQALDTIARARTNLYPWIDALDARG